MDREEVWRGGCVGVDVDLGVSFGLCFEENCVMIVIVRFFFFEGEIVEYRFFFQSIRFIVFFFLFGKYRVGSFLEISWFDFFIL